MKSEIEAKSEQIEQLENERTASSSNYTQQLAKKDDKYKALKTEYNSLNDEYAELKRRSVSMEEELNKMKEELDRIKQDHEQLQTQMVQVKGDSTMAVKL